MTVVFHGSVQQNTRGDRSFEAGTVQSVYALIDLLGEHYGENFRKYLLGDETCFFLVNGNGTMATGGLNTKLNPDCKVEVLPFVDAG